MIDIAHTSDGDIELATGDLAYNESSEQHQLGILNFLQVTDPENLLRTTRKQFAKDSMKVQKIAITQGKINVDARYEDSKS